ncbi:MAG: dihydroneopterin aldolase [Gammaproteobacteria bacterium]|nr:dihydroneopterin aldolase [Gammaproteobacteria bacterium]
MDIIFIKELKIECVIGIWDWERATTQTVRVDLEIGTDISKAAASDDIKDTLDYKALSKRLQEVASAQPFGLVEKLAETIAQTVLTEFGARSVRLTLNKKGALRDARDVGVVIERKQ